MAAIAAGKMHGVAKQALILSTPVLNSKGHGGNSAIIKALNHIAQSGRESGSIVNLSLGGPESKTLNAVVDAIVQQGIVVVVAAGNENTDACIKSPAGAPGAITVRPSSSSF